MKSTCTSLSLAALAILSGCATTSGSPDMSQLAVYPDNRVGYVMSSSGSSAATRVWSTGDTILALRFGNRIVNALDIDTITVKETDRKHVPLSITVRLKSGETLTADVADWGKSIYSDTFVDWLACTRNKICEYIDRTASSPQTTSKFLVNFSEGSFESLARSGQNPSPYLSYKTSAALPGSRGLYQLRFGEVKEISDLSSGIEAARAALASEKKCIADAIAAEHRNRKATEEKIIKTTPPVEVEQKLAAWRATLSEGSAQQLVLEMGCKRS